MKKAVRIDGAQQPRISRPATQRANERGPLAIWKSESPVGPTIIAAAVKLLGGDETGLLLDGRAAGRLI